MEQISGTFELAKYLPVCLAILLWLFYWRTRRTRRTLSRHERMKELTPAHTQDETLDRLINAECELLPFSFLLSSTMSLIAAVTVLVLM
ncbi:hypothetical protein [Pantoea agglomerans]|uniref:hypothetical protein n=1 Tax=Enterobacter agglomerans TaxID=549 RepID=UPI003C7E52E5